MERGHESLLAIPVPLDYQNRLDSIEKCLCIETLARHFVLPMVWNSMTMCTIRPTSFQLYLPVCSMKEVVWIETSWSYQNTASSYACVVLK